MIPAHRRILLGRRRRGLGLVELLVSLAIVAALLVAVAVGTHASFQAYAVNQEYSQLNQRARVAVHRMLSDIRTAEAHAVDTNPSSAGNTSFKAGTIVSGSKTIAMYDSSDALHVYRWDSAAKKLYADVKPFGATTTSSYTLLEGVDNFAVTLEPMKSLTAARTGGQYDLLKRATILLTVRATGSGDERGDNGEQQTMTVSSSVVPRKNVW